MKLTALVKEAITSSRAARIPAIMAAVVTAAMCLAALLTVGKNAANQAQVAGQLEAAGARLLTVTDMAGDGFVNNRTVAVIAELSTVQTAVGVGTPVDGVNGVIGWGGTRVAAWPVHGDLHRVVTLIDGRWPRPGEAVIDATTQRQLGLAAPAGYLRTTDGANPPIVGLITLRDPFGDLTGAIVNANNQLTATEVRVVVDKLTDVEATQSSVLTILSPPDPSRVQVSSPTGIAETARAVGSQLAGYGRSLLLLILSAGAFFVATVVLADSLVRRRDLGRRRTLGATRGDLTSLVVLRTVFPAVAGAALGCTAAALLNARAHYPTPIAFVVAIGVLAVLTAAVAALPPAWFAATRDPVEVMRVP